MKKSIIINVLIGLLILFCKVNIWSQPVALGCGGDRYVEEVFSATSMTTVTYGEALNYDGTITELEMDVFQAENDTISRRPVVILAHSIVDDRSEMHPLCEEFARRGYVAASIGFREGGDGTVTFDNYVRIGIRHMQDMKAAVRYFRNDSNTANLFKVDTNFVFVGGFSFGGIMSLHTAYWDEGDNEDPIVDSLINIEGGLEGHSNDFLDVSSRVQGVINLSGTMLFKEWINEGDAAVVSYHGTNDIYVSMGHDLFEGIFYMDGSEEIHQEATIKNIPNYFHPVSGGGHFDIYEAVFSDEYDAFKAGTFQLFKDSVLCKNLISSIPIDLLTEQVVKLFPNPVSDELNIEIDLPDTENLQAEVFDLAGKKITEYRISYGKNSIPVSELLQGSYFISVKENGKVLKTEKVVVLR